MTTEDKIAPRIARVPFKVKVKRTPSLNRVAIHVQRDQGSATGLARYDTLMLQTEEAGKLLDLLKNPELEP